MKRILLTFSLVLVCLLITAQVPQGFNYQAVAHSSTGAPIINTTLQAKIGILSDTLTPVVVWEELHSTVKTNANGVFNLVIGTGTRQSGSASAFSDIDWSKTPLFLKIQIYYQNAWKYLGTSKLWSVPFSMASGNKTDVSGVQTEINAIETGAGLNDNGTYPANTAANYIAAAASLKDADNKLDAQLKINSDKIATIPAKMLIKGTESSADSALFRIVNKNGQTVFAVYNEGVRIYVDDGAKGAKGGFAVGGFGSEKSPSQNLFVVNPDSIRAYVNTESAKGAKGGFAVGGFSGAKAPSQNLFVVNADSIRAYIDTSTGKGAKGGFAVGGFSGAKAPSQNLLVVNADSIRAYIDTSTGKGAKGGFAVGGFDAGKGAGEEYLRVTRDSTRIYLNNTGIKGAKGGFAVGGFGSSKGSPNGFMFIDPDSTRFYLRQSGPGSSSTFNIVGINLDQTQTSLLSANTDTVGIAGVLNVQNNMTVAGNIGYTGTVNLIVPDITTLEPFNITESSAMVGADIISNGGAVVIESGVCWSTSSNPTVKLSTKTTDGTLLGQFTSTITGLTATTTYYVRAYATNANGTGYGQEITFTTPSPATTVTDFDGNVYNVIVIGTQSWMASNLKAIHLNDGSAIPKVSDNFTWSNLVTPGYVWYNNDSATYSGYGILYNWNTVNTGTLCPTGWHVPTETELSTLISFLGGPIVAGGKLKETGTTHWLSPNTGATDEVGFKALPGGIRNYMGPFSGVGDIGAWWSSTRISTDPSSVSMYSGTAEMMLQFAMQMNGQSVRCIMNAK
jgi:uncharacterized protein (TIGR02145 family)